MKNIYVLQTDKPSRLRYFCGRLERMYAIPKKSNIEYQNIYITSDEEIKVGDWFISLYSNSIQKELKLDWTLNKDAYKKIILTTDQDLIKDGVQAIDDEFLEWFVKNPSCEEVEVTSERRNWKEINYVIIYKIIIPKDEPKQETLEEAYNRIYKSIDFTEFDFASFAIGVKYQQEKSYSEEEVLDILGDFFYDHVNHQSANIEEWFKQFKKK